MTKYDQLNPLYLRDKRISKEVLFWCIEVSPSSLPSLVSPFLPFIFPEVRPACIPRILWTSGTLVERSSWSHVIQSRSQGEPRGKKIQRQGHFSGSAVQGQERAWKLCIKQRKTKEGQSLFCLRPRGWHSQIVRHGDCKEAALVGECVVELAGWRVLSASRKVRWDGCGTKRLFIFITSSQSFSQFLSFDF